MCDVIAYCAYYMLYAMPPYCRTSCAAISFNPITPSHPHFSQYTHMALLLHCFTTNPTSPHFLQHAYSLAIFSITSPIVHRIKNLLASIAPIPEHCNNFQKILHVAIIFFYEVLRISTIEFMFTTA